MSKWWLLFLVVAMVLVAGCTGDETTTEVSTPEGDVEITFEEGAEGECPVGTTYISTYPETNQEITLEIVGTDEIEGVEVCHAVAELEGFTGADDVEISKVEYYWSEEGEVVIWTAYDSSDDVVYEMRVIGESVTITTAEGTLDFSNFGTE
ncbi:hypothetical protein J2755_000702 [Methanohalophilus levihalophilus]|uniref:hypothetical protein n=1 Tax=Methanohalophilus levihalophilus TaxID=1431282 RepID=UPI001AE6513C|nr:hypothetical protein [Methanohalophilus levihalophilus]MBP2029782.1 hypothetical protein [Methanohalophilus levihalophilus]